MTGVGSGWEEANQLSATAQDDGACGLKGLNGTSSIWVLRLRSLQSTQAAPLRMTTRVVAFDKSDDDESVALHKSDRGYRYRFIEAWAGCGLMGLGWGRGVWFR
jgi:hypothetical protein